MWAPAIFFDGLLQKSVLMQAIAGVDIAIWDAIGKLLGAPLYQLLGGYRDTLDAYASAGFYARDKTPQDLADEVGGYAAAGFKVVKIVDSAPVIDPTSTAG